MVSPPAQIVSLRLCASVVNENAFLVVVSSTNNHEPQTRNYKPAFNHRLLHSSRRERQGCFDLISEREIKRPNKGKTEPRIITNKSIV